MQEIDVEQIMQGIRQEIAEKGYKASDLKFVDISVEQESPVSENAYDEKKAQTEMDYLNFHYNNPVVFPLTGNPIKVFIRKVLRRMSLFVIMPAFQYQNRYNASLVRFLNQNMLYIQENRQLKEQLKEQQEQLDALRQTVQKLQEQQGK